MSNIPEEGNGRTIYQKRIKPVVVDYPKVANQWVISWLKDRERQCPHHIYHYRVEPQDLEDGTQGSLLFAAGRLTLTSGVTRNEPGPGLFHGLLGELPVPHPGPGRSSGPGVSDLEGGVFPGPGKDPGGPDPFMVRRLGETLLQLPRYLPG